MLKFALNDSISIHKIKHEDPEIVVYVIDDFLENPEELIDYARKKPTLEPLEMTEPLILASETDCPASMSRF